MAVYKIFPEKSATIYSEYPTKNTGLDEIIEIGVSGSNLTRTLIKFSQENIQQVIDDVLPADTDFAASLKLYLAHADSLPIEYSLIVAPVSSSWDMGTGRKSNDPITTDGVTWEDRNSINGWTLPGGDYLATNTNIQSFTHNTKKDIIFNVSEAVQAFALETLVNHGFLIKAVDSVESLAANNFSLKYFSSNTHTIYPPCLEIKWDDSIYSPGTLTTLTSNNIVVAVNNNKGKFMQGSIQRFRLSSREQFPARSFQTTSVYLENKVLPQTSYWAIQDMDTNEMVIDFDETYTKVSADVMGNFFDIYMDGLEPERNYKILIKTVINDSTLIIDNKNYFKVIR